MSRETYTTHEAAAALGVTPARVRQMVLGGLLPAEKFGRDLVITAEAIEIAKQRKTAPGPIPKATQAEKRATSQANASNSPSRGKKKGRK